MHYWILLIFTIFLSIYGKEESNNNDYTRLIIHFKENFWQYEINDMIINNTSLYNNDNNIDIDRYIMKFIWRDNLASLIPTNFGLIEVLPTKYTTISDYLQYFNGLKYYHGNNKSFLTKYIDYVSLDCKNNINSLAHNNKNIEIIEDDGEDEEDIGHFKIQRRKHLNKGFTIIKLPKYSDTSSTTSNDHIHRTILQNKLKGNITSIRNKTVISRFISSSIGSDIFNDGFTGKGIKVAVFDTGTNDNHPHFNNVKQIFDWTNEHSKNDSVGHGSFVAGVISGIYKDCPGLAPDADLYIFRVFTSNQLSYTSWFLDAFNYAIFLGINVINLSIGGPDHGDRPFIEKINEVTANGIVLVSAIGNDGPRWGTLYSPADQIDVVGVGGWNKDDKVAKFSSRGMTTWELPYGTGRVKPDILAPSVNVYSSSNEFPYKCRSLSGTSVASPVVAGAAALLLSTLSSTNKKLYSNIATIKQILISSSTRLNESSIFEQGGGLINLTKSYYNIQKHIPHASLFPSWISNLPSDCPYMWPWCTQSLYATSQPLLSNLTIFNSMNVIGKIKSFELIEELEGDYIENNLFKSVFYPNLKSENTRPYLSISGNLFEIHIQHSDIIYPYSGYLALSISVKVPNLDKYGLMMQSFVGNAKIRISVNIESPSNIDYLEVQQSKAIIDFNLIVIDTPHRSKRLLWDTFHNIGYPSPFVPKDDLDNDSQSFDLHGDHPHTNYHSIYNYLLKQGYYVEILRSSFLCFDSNNYGMLVIIDPEEEFWPEEINKLETDIKMNGLSLLIIADWYDEYEIMRNQFKDESKIFTI
jgi:membrane-bound transcription factor site-1 protease